MSEPGFPREGGQKQKVETLRPRALEAVKKGGLFRE